MGIVRVNQIEVYAYHGCLPEEAIIGSRYIVDVAVHADFSQAGMSDEIRHTVDYVVINQIVLEEMAVRARLIETVAYRIAENVKKRFSKSEKCWVRIAKLAAPMPGQAESVCVEVEL